MGYDILEPETYEPQSFAGYDILEPEEEVQEPYVASASTIPEDPTEPEIEYEYPYFKKVKDPLQRAKDLSILPKNEREKLIQSLPEAEQSEVRKLTEQAAREEPFIGPLVTAAGAGIKEVAKLGLPGIPAEFDIEDPVIKKQKNDFERYGLTVDQFRDERGNIDITKVDELPSTGIAARDENRKYAANTFLGKLKVFEEKGPAAKKYKEKVTEVGKHIKGFGEYMSPDEIKKYKIRERIEKIRDVKGNEYAEAWEKGDLSFVISQMIGDAAIADDPDKAKEFVKLRKQFNKALAWKELTSEKKGIIKKLFINTIEMLAPMTKTGVKMAVPGVGKAWGLYEWSRQGAGDVYADLIEGGVSHETARKIVPIAGITYAGVEQLQISQLANIAGITQGMTREGIRKVIFKILKEKGKNYFHEVGEEGLQRFITDTGVEIGKQSENISEKEMGDYLWESVKNVAEEMGSAAGPMGVLTALGIGGAGVSAGFERRAQTTAMLGEEIEKIREENIAAKEEETFAKLKERFPTMDEEQQDYALLGLDEKKQNELLATLEEKKPVEKLKGEKVEGEELTPEEKEFREKVGPHVKGEPGYEIIEEEEKAVEELKSEGVEEKKERKTQRGERKPISEMTLEEAQNALSTDRLTSLGSELLWGDVEKKPGQGFADVDGLKWINDNLGYESGNILLKSVANALQEAGVEAYRIGGDEIRFQGENKKTIDKQIKKAYNILRDKTITVEKPDGEIITIKGLGFSYGTSENPDYEVAKAESERFLHKNKAEREKTGLRGARAEQPPGVSRISPQGKPDYKREIETEKPKEKISSKKKKPVEELKGEGVEAEKEINRFGYPSTILSKNFYGGKTEKPVFTKEFESLPDDEKHSVLKSEKKLIDDQIKKLKDENATVGFVRLENLKKKYTQIQKKYSRAAETKARREQKQIDTYAETGTPKTKIQERVQKDLDYFLTTIEKSPDIDVKEINDLLQSNYSEEVLTKAIKAVKQGKKDGKPAQEIRKEIGEYFAAGSTPADLMGMFEEPVSEEGMREFRFEGEEKPVEELKSGIVEEEEPVLKAKRVDELKGGKVEEERAEPSVLYEGQPMFAKGLRFAEESGDIFEGTEHERRIPAQIEADKKIKERKGGKADVSDLPFFQGGDGIVGGAEQQTLFARGRPIVFSAEAKDVLARVSPDLLRNIDITFARKFGEVHKYSLGAGDRGAIYRKGDRLHIVLNPALSSDEIARTLVHELMGHAGVANVLRGRPDIYKRITTIYNTQKKSPVLEKIKKNYAEELKEYPEWAEDVVFSEWIAYNMEDYFSNPKKKGVAYYIWKEIRKFLSKIGIIDENLDDVLYNLSEEIRTVKFTGPSYVVKHKKPDEVLRRGSVKALKAKIEENNKKNLYKDLLGKPIESATISGYATIDRGNYKPPYKWYFKSVSEDERLKPLDKVFDSYEKIRDVARSLDFIVPDSAPIPGYESSLIIADYPDGRKFMDNYIIKMKEKWKNAKPVYIRYGKIRENKLSYNYRDAKYEKGLSVFRGKLLPDGEFAVIIETTYQLGSKYAVEDRKAYIVEGEEVGIGADGEPLLANIKIMTPEQAAQKYFKEPPLKAKQMFGEGEIVPKPFKAPSLPEQKKRETVEKLKSERVEELKREGVKAGKTVSEPTDIDIDYVKKIEKEIRSLRGKLIHISEGYMLDRANISLKIKEMSEKKADIVRNLIWDYAKKIGLRGEPWNRVDTLIKNAKTASYFERAVEIMDDVLMRRQRYSLLKKVRETFKEERKRLRGIEGRKIPTVSYEQNVRLKEYIESFQDITTKDDELTQKLLDDFENDPDELLSEDSKKEIAQLLRPNLRDMNSKQLTEILVNIKQIKKLGKLKYEILADRKKRKINDDAEEAAHQIRIVTKKPTESLLKKATKRGVVSRRFKSLENLAKKFGWSHIRPERIIEWFTGFRESNFKKNVFDRALTAEKTELENMETVYKKFESIHDGLNLPEAVNKPYMKFEYDAFDENTLQTRIDRIELTLDQMMFIYANSQNPGNRAHLLGTGVDDHLIDKVVLNLPDEYKNAVDKMIDYYDQIQHPRMNEVFKREHQIDMPHEHRYFPILNLKTDRAENQMMIDMIARYSARRSSVQKGMTKSRVQSKAPYRKMSYFDTVFQNLKSSEHYIAYNDAIRDINQYLNNRELRAAMEARSEEATAQIKDWLKAVAYGKARRTTNVIDKVSDWLRTNYMTAVLGFNLITMAKQPASFSQGLERVNKVGAVVSAAKFLKNPFELNKFVNSKSAMMKNRGQSFERELAEMAEKNDYKKRLGIMNIFGNTKDFAMQGIRAADKSTTVILWYTKYNELMHKTGNEDYAIQVADEIIRKTQPMGGITHLPQIYRGGGLARAYTMFSNQLNQNLNLLFEMQQKWGETKNIDKISQTAFYMIIPSMIIYMASHGGRLPWKDKLGWARAFVNNITGGLMLINKLIEAGTLKITNRIKEARLGKADTRKLEYALDFAPTSFGALEDLGMGIGRGNPEKVFDSMMKFTGTPYIAAKRAWRGFKKFKETKDPRYFIWSEYALKDNSVRKQNIDRFKKTSLTLDDKMKVWEYYNRLPIEKKKKFSKEIPDFSKQYRKIQKGLFGERVWDAKEKVFIQRGGADNPGKRIWNDRTKKFETRGRTGFAERIDNLKERYKKGKITEQEYQKRLRKVEKEREKFRKWKEKMG